MTQATIQPAPCAFPVVGPSSEGVSLLPDGPISIEVEGNQWVLRASHRLQARFEHLLERRKTGDLDAVEAREYEAICELDTALTWLNRLARDAQPQ